MTLTVIVLNYNSGEYLTRCLDSLAAQDCDDFTVIVADNCSTDTSFDAAKTALQQNMPRWNERFRFVQIGSNTGFARGNNLMVADVTTPLVALLNPDALPKQDWVRTLLLAASRYPGTAMFGSTQISLDDPRRYDGVGDNYLAPGVPWRGGHGHVIGDLPTDREVFSPCAAAAMYRTEAYRAVGGMDEAYFCYIEDVDLGFRMRLAGEHCLQISEAVVEHAGGASSRSSGQAFARYHGTRNMIWTFVKNMPGPLFWVLVPVHLLVLAVLAGKALFRGEGGVILLAIGDALSGLPKIWRQRREIAARREASIAEIATAMVWNPLRYLQKTPVYLNPSDRYSESMHKTESEI